MIAEARSLVEITQEALRLPYRELGLINTVRFLNQFTAGFGNYTEERRSIIEDQTLECDKRRYPCNEIQSQFLRTSFMNFVDDGKSKS